MESFNENVIEFITNDKTATVTFSQGRYVSKIKKLAEKFPDEVKIVYTNKDGSIVAHVPVSAIKLNIVKRELTEEQRQEMAERLRLAREQGQEVDEDDMEDEED
jgi:hypothetical protein